jgi:hypothetical protein
MHFPIKAPYNETKLPVFTLSLNFLAVFIFQGNEGQEEQH